MVPLRGLDRGHPPLHRPRPNKRHSPLATGPPRAQHHRLSKIELQRTRHCRLASTLAQRRQTLPSVPRVAGPSNRQTPASDRRRCRRFPNRLRHPRATHHGPRLRRLIHRALPPAQSHPLPGMRSQPSNGCTHSPGLPPIRSRAGHSPPPSRPRPIPPHPLRHRRRRQGSDCLPGGNQSLLQAKGRTFRPRIATSESHHHSRSPIPITSHVLFPYDRYSHFTNILSPYTSHVVDTRARSLSPDSRSI